LHCLDRLSITRDAFGNAAAFAYHAQGACSSAGGTHFGPAIQEESDMTRSMAISLTAGLMAAYFAAAAQAQTATAALAPTAGNTAAGTVTFTQKGDKVSVNAKLTGLAPGGHGFHIHEKGDCSAPDAMSAGGHFNPTGKPHGSPDAADHHAGDMPMLQADASGNATLTADLAIAGGVADITGKSVIVHKDADDFKTQPTGNSGARVACGVINKT
jgi:Cu-Zn family superoxide dismutase